MGFVRQITGKEGQRVAGEAAAIQGQAIGSAAELEAQTAREALEESRRQFGITQEQLQPFQEIELGALRRAEEMAVPAQQELTGLLGFRGPEAQAEARRGILESPAQQALRDRAARLSTRTAAAIGGLGGGNIRRELFEGGRAIDEAALQQRINQLGALAGRQLAPGATQFGAGLRERQTGATTGLMTGIGGIMGGGLRDVAGAQASGLLGGQQARAQGVQNILKIGGMTAGFATGGAGGGLF